MDPRIGHLGENLVVLPSASADHVVRRICDHWMDHRPNDRGCRAATLFICAASQLPWVALWNWPIWRLAHSGLPFFRSFPVLFNVMVMFIGMPISILLGGLLLPEREREDDRPPGVSLTTP
jgi:hypothetical protein